MIKLFKVKEHLREQAQNANGNPPVKKLSARELHLREEAITKLFKEVMEKQREQAEKQRQQAENQREQAEKQREQAENAIRMQREQAENSNGKPPVKKQSAGELRLINDISELNLPKICSISFPNGKDDLMNFEINILPDEGYYMGGQFTFSFSISPLYPYEAPKVKCMTQVFHPNIDLKGNVCLNVLREGYWKPVFNINTISYSLYHLFMEPIHVDPLNHVAAATLRDDPTLFGYYVRRGMIGGLVGNVFFAPCMVNFFVWISSRIRPIVCTYVLMNLCSN